MSTFIAHGIRHIFGTITSASRKEIIPDLEQHNLLLWIMKRELAIEFSRVTEATVTSRGSRCL